VPLVVLVDGGSASAAEGASRPPLREKPARGLVGQKTFGKGTVRELHVASDFASAACASRWHSGSRPVARAIRGQGLLPDVEVAPADPPDATRSSPGVECPTAPLGAGVARG
jgi:C-terminal processing protease CtpA/Prc